MNLQPPEKLARESGPYLDVQDVFHTIQGEGPYSGHRALFIRLAGCNLQCVTCDTDYTSRRETRSARAVALQFRRGNGLVVITGGEPFRQNITWLCELLLERGAKIQIESNGTYPPSPRLDKRVEVVCSPKTGSVNKKLLPYIVAYKYVIPPYLASHTKKTISDNDGLPLRMLESDPPIARPHDTRIPVYITPEAHPTMGHVDPSTIDNIIDGAKEFGYIAQCQLHKFLRIE